MAGGAKSIKAGEAFLELSIRDGQFRRSIDQSISKLRSLGASLKSIGSFGISGGGLGGLQRAIALITGSALLSAPVRLAAGLEVAEAAFTALTGSAEKARTILFGLQTLSGRTSFSFETLQGAARNMLNFGVATEQVLPLMHDLSAIAAGDADRLDRLAVAFGQTQAKGRLMAEEVRQMVNAGFNPLQEIARTTGRSMGQLLKDMEAGAISAAQVAEAFQSVVGPGGRFAGILALIENTAIGQFRKLAAGIKIAVIPLGKELLPIMTDVLKTINDLIPSMSAIIRANASWAKVIAVTVLGLSGLLATLFSIGVAFQVVAFSAAGLLGALSVLTSPIVLIAGSLAGLTTILVKFTNVGASAFGFLADKFGDLAGIARDTFGSIADALSGGDIVAAANVLWAGLRLAWLKGTEELRGFWIDYKFFFLQNTTELVFGAMKLWEVFAAGLKGIWASLVTESQAIGEQIGHALTRSDDPELAADQDAAHQVALDNIAREGAARQQAIQNELDTRLAAIETERGIAEEDRKNRAAAEIAAARKAQQEAQKNFDDARKRAEQSRLPDRGGFEADFQAALGDIGATSRASGARSTFSGRLAPQVFGGGAPDNTAKQHLAETKKVRHAMDDLKNNGFKIKGGVFIPVGAG